jgi:hypothetical protein
VANLRPWKPGESGNPSGRPKGIARAVRDRVQERLGGPEALADVLLDTLEDPRLKPQERVMIIRELWDRGYGKAASFAAIEGADPLELDEVSEEIVRLIGQLRAEKAA